jgi:hypothetical protein
MAEFDLAALAVAFARSVRDGGIPSTPERTVRFAQALALADPTHRAELYWTARTIFVSSREQIPTFDSIFARVFEGLVDPADTRGDRTAPALPVAAEAGPRPPLARATAERGLTGARKGAPGIRERGDSSRGRRRRSTSWAWQPRASTSVWPSATLRSSMRTSCSHSDG